MTSEKDVKFLRLMVAAGSLLFSLTLHAAPIVSYLVTLDTTVLIGGTYNLEFQLNDGDGVQNSKVTLHDFAFGGGSAVAGTTTVGGVSGNAGSSVVMQDVNFFNEFIQGFNAGSALSFAITFESDASGSVPDEFSFAILNSSLVELQTTGSGNQLLSIDASNGAFALATYSGVASPGDPTLGTPTVTGVPEPGSLALVVLAAFLLPLTRRVAR